MRLSAPTRRASSASCRADGQPGRRSCGTTSSALLGESGDVAQGPAGRAPKRAGHRRHDRDHSPTTQQPPKVGRWRLSNPSASTPTTSGPGAGRQSPPSRSVRPGTASTARSMSGCCSATLVRSPPARCEHGRSVDQWAERRPVPGCPTRTVPSGPMTCTRSVLRTAGVLAECPVGGHLVAGQRRRGCAARPNGLILGTWITPAGAEPEHDGEGEHPPRPPRGRDGRAASAGTRSRLRREPVADAAHRLDEFRGARVVAAACVGSGRRRRRRWRSRRRRSPTRGRGSRSGAARRPGRRMK